MTSEADAGGRLDVFLSRQLGVSRREVRQLLEAGAVSVDGRPAHGGDKGLLLVAGRCVRVERAEMNRGGQVIPEPELPLDVLAQGDGYVAVDKLPGVAVHPLRSGERGTMLNRVVGRYPQVQGVGEGGLRSGVVHRLDVETSGVLVIATSDDRWRQLRDAFAEHRTQKIYRAIVCGKLTGSGREQMDLVIARRRPAKVKVVAAADCGKHSGVRRCNLRWQAIETFQGATLVQVQLGTGFLHQIRVMMAHMGHPVIGDRVYGDAKIDPVAAPRQMLHASRLHVEDIDAHSPDPADFAGLLAGLRRS